MHTIADVNMEKDERREKEGKPPRGGGAGRGVLIGSLREKATR